MTWALESWNLARTNAYVNVTRSVTPSTTYLNTTMATTEQRMATGGHRLADLLNTLFTSPILAAMPLTGGSFKFSWVAVSNTTYRVQWKTQLTDAAWTDLTTVKAASNSAAFTETAGQTQRFYRLVQ
jgi:S1/P1 Nuclease